MTDGSLSIRETARYTRNSSLNSFGVREVLKQDSGKLRLEGKRSSFSVITYNLGLLVGPATYLGTDRDGAMAEAVQRIKDNKPDVVGLCEVFADGEREKICSDLSSVYQHFREGPDIDGIFDRKSDGGLLILSKYPILDDNKIIYSKCKAWDCLAYKGAIHIRIQPPGSPNSWDIFYTHAQDIWPDKDEPYGAKDELYFQLSELSKMVEDKRDPNNPCIIMGDLNIPAEINTHYDALIYRLDGKGMACDLWRAKNMDMNGFTFTMGNNFYEDPRKNPDHNSRLDYILLKPGLSFLPVLKDIEILKWTHSGRNISDHFGLHATFEQGLQIER